MIPSSLQIEATSDGCTEPEELAGGAEAELKKRPKKARSIRISRWSSLRSSFRRGKSQFQSQSQSNPYPVILCSEADCSEQSTPSEMSTCSSFSESSSTAMELKKKKKKLQSPNYFKPTTSSDARKPHFKASPRDSESGSDLSRPSSSSHSTKSAKTLTRKASNKSVRVLTKTISLKHQRPLARKGSVVSSDLSVHKPTCSSVLKGAKIPGDAEIRSEGSGVMVKKVCPYTYCSLHGHKHDASPPLKQFVSSRRRLIKSQKGAKPESHSPQRAKQSGSKKKRNQNAQMGSNQNCEVRGIDNADVEAKLKEESIAGDDEAIINFGNVAEEVVLGEASYSLSKSEENLRPIHFAGLKEEDVAVSNLDNASNNLEEDVAVSNLDNASNNLEEDVVVFNLDNGSIAGVDEATIDFGNVVEEQIELGEASSTPDISEENLGQIHCADLEEEDVAVSNLDCASNNLGEDAVVSNIGNANNNLEEGVVVSNIGSASNLLEEETVVSNLRNPSNNLEEGDLTGVTGGEPLFEYKIPIPEDEVESSTAINSMDISALVSNSLQEPYAVSEEASYTPSKPEENLQQICCTDLKEEDGAVSNLDNGCNTLEEGVFVSNLDNASNKLEEDVVASSLDSASNNLEEGVVVSNLNSASNNLEEGVGVSNLDSASNNLEGVGVSNLDNPSNVEEDINVSNLDNASNNVEEDVKVSKLDNTRGNLEEDVDEFNLDSASHDLEEGVDVSNIENARDNLEDDVAVSNLGNTSNNLEAGIDESNLENARNNLEEDIAVANLDSSSNNLEEGVAVSNLENESNNLEEHIVASNLDRASNNLEPLCESKIPIPEDLVESTPIPSMAIFASVSSSLHESSAATEERELDSAADSQGFPKFMVSDPQSSTDEETTTSSRKQNYSGLWNLIYRQMESDIDETSKGKKEEDANTLLRMNSTGSSRGISRTSSSNFAEDQDADNQEIQLNQTDAIKLVQEAINAILYPETRELSSDEQSITSDTISEHGEGEDISSSTDLDEGKFGKADCRMSEDQAMLLKPEKNPKEMSKSKLMASKRWSNLKKVILMKRFVKALDRMRKFNPKKPNYLPLEPDPESEKVSLRRQMTEERKNAEEFMLDYALRQVISKLAPAQKKKVELLVNAFETFIPGEKNETPRFRINLGTSSPVNHAQIWTGSPEQIVRATRKENEDQVCNSRPEEQHSEEKAPGIKETTSDRDQIVRVNLNDGDSKFISKVMETTSLISSKRNQFEMSGSSTPGSTAINNVVSSRSVVRKWETAASYKTNAESKPSKMVSPEFSPPEESDPVSITGSTPETPKQNYSRLWFLLHKHMASGVTETDESQDKVDDVQSDTSDSLHGLSVSETDQDIRREDEKADQQKKKLQEEAIKLVQDAIDQILLPEVEDRFSDDQSISSDTTPEQEELFNSTSTVPVKETCTNPDKMEVAKSSVPDPGETRVVSTNLNNQGEKTTVKEEGKSTSRAPKNWSNLKKMILLRRFVKALEKVRKLNPREPRFLPVDPNAESEKVNLKHQDMEDRKNAEEWMLDYAIQQVVTKLTPARKKKVQLLVEAFETVTPAMETEPYMRRSPAASSRAHPFKSVLGH